ncbi:MAG: cytochrome c oxidase subunit II [Gammaproteobacteria bacterium]|nr:cytochrome c oxidase subunit II [Gammaproteobacteria bacterium]
MAKMGWMARAALVSVLLAASGAASAYTTTGNGWNTPQGVTEISAKVYDLHLLIFWVCVAIGVLVFGAMTYSIVMHRRSVHPKPADFHESTTVEIVWTVIPFLILIGMAIPAAGTLIKMEDTRGAELSVKVTGYQWKWQYEYLDQGVGFFSTLHPDSNKARQVGSGIDPTTVPNYLVEVDEPLVLPVGKKVRFLITANDVIHAWWVPDLAVKKDAIPGYVNEVWTKIDKPGTYRGVCAELCGRDHGFMPIVVVALPEEEFGKWLEARKAGQPYRLAAAAPTQAADVPPAAAAQPAPAGEQVAAAPATAASAGELSKAELMAKGEQVYKANCAACHQANGAGMAPTFPPLAGSKMANGPAEAHIAQMFTGKMMPSFRHLSDADLAAVATYERNSWGNTGSIVQPAQVAALRK